MSGWVQTATALLDVMNKLNLQITTANNLIRQSISKADDNTNAALAIQDSINQIKTNSAFGAHSAQSPPQIVLVLVFLEVELTILELEENLTQ